MGFHCLCSNSVMAYRLLAAESIIGNAVGTDNDYMKTTYRYLNNLYARWKKPEKAIE